VFGSFQIDNSNFTKNRSTGFQFKMHPFYKLTTTVVTNLRDEGIVFSRWCRGAEKLRPTREPGMTCGAATNGQTGYLEPASGTDGVGMRVSSSVAKLRTRSGWNERVRLLSDSRPTFTDAYAVAKAGAVGRGPAAGGGGGGRERRYRVRRVARRIGVWCELSRTRSGPRVMCVRRRSLFSAAAAKGGEERGR
jgi:hypothetical protein